MPNDDIFINPQQTPERPESDSAESHRYAAFLLFAVAALCIAVFFFLAAMTGRQVGTPIVVMLAYTFLFALIVFKSRVPLDRLTRRKFLLEHCLALAIVYALTTAALAAKPHLPTWFITEGIRGGSFFDLCCGAVLFVVAICEFSWGLRVELRKVFVDSLLNPPPPNAAARVAAERYRGEMES